MATELEDLKILQNVEGIADAIWKRVVQWEQFAKDVVGRQITRSVDSVGANIAESYGRFNYGEKLQFLYYSRGSLFETKYWLNRVLARELMPAEEVKAYATRLSDVARQLNTFASSLKSQRKDTKAQSKSVREPGAEYIADDWLEDSTPLFNTVELDWLTTLPEVSSLQSLNLQKEL